jgi:hypothetical protein
MEIKLFFISGLLMVTFNFAKAEVAGLGKLIQTGTKEAVSTHCKIQKALGMECKKIMLAQSNLDDSEFKVKLTKAVKQN